jgi:hypothetical protein
MTDPAVAYLPDVGYGSYDRGTAQDLWLKAESGGSSLGLVWPGEPMEPRICFGRMTDAVIFSDVGVTVYPGKNALRALSMLFIRFMWLLDWFHPQIQK